MFSLYLLGFLIWPPWRDTYCVHPSTYAYLESEPEEEVLDEPINARLSNPIYVPIKTDRDLDKSSGTESDDSSLRSVRFSKVAEVRQLSEIEASDALMARLGYQAYLRANEIAKRANLRLPVHQVSKLAFVFCLLVRNHKFFILQSEVVIHIL